MITLENSAAGQKVSWRGKVYSITKYRLGRIYLLRGGLLRSFNLKLFKSALESGSARFIQDEAKSIRRNRLARERHWTRTGVSSSTVSWMKQTGWL